MTASKIFLLFCLSFIGGIFIGSTLGFLKGNKEILLLPGLISGIILISVFWQYKTPVIIGFCVLFLVLGIWRHQNIESKIENNELRKYNNLNQSVTLVGIVSAEPDLREKSQKLIISVRNDKVLLTVDRYPEYEYGDKLKITGKLENPSENVNGVKEDKSSSSPLAITREFNYRDYLKKDGIYFVMAFPKIKLLGHNFGNPIMKILLSFKNKFKETAAQFISPPELGILEALIFGDEENIPDDFKNKLNLTGTRHITAVSGMNITIISSLILNFLLILGLWRQQAFYFTIFMLIAYILMIGAPASAVRAGVMAGLFLLAQHLGRLSAGQRAVVFAAAFMLVLNPLLLRLDVGFQLSFLAILGMIYFQPFFSELLKKIPNPKFFPVATTLSATLSAQIFTLPILIYNFGYISLTSPITNILIVPFLAPISILIFVFGLAGVVFYHLGLILSLPVWLCLTYITKVIDLFSKVSFASLKLENIHWFWLAIFYLMLGAVIWRLQEQQRLKFLEY